MGALMMVSGWVGLVEFDHCRVHGVLGWWGEECFEDRADLPVGWDLGDSASRHDASIARLCATLSG